MSTDLKLSKVQSFKINQSGGFLRSFLSKLAGPSMKVAIPLAKNFFALLVITAAASVINTGNQKKIHNSFNNFTLRNELHNENCSGF